ncbi:MAG: DedA family protein [Pseudomonadales bacterium]|nr:DedA family protein [Pseudomonadales bacterium]
MINEVIFQWVDSNLGLAIFLIPLFAFAEACIGIGLFISGIFLVAIASIVLDQEIAGLPVIATLAFFGALAGDHVGFYVGRWSGPHFHHLSFVEKHRESFDKAERLIRYYGPFAVFIGRFIPAIRSIIPALLGITEFEKIKFSILDCLACLLWSIALAAIVYGIDNIF